MEGFQLVHGSPLDEDTYIVGPGQALPVLRTFESSTVFFGHTHYQGGFTVTPNGRFQSIRIPPKGDGLTFSLLFEEGGRYLINPGSIGQPRDGDWRAAFAIFDAEHRAVEYYRTAYDLHKTQEKMRQAGLPEPLINRLALGR
jgi:diadenosine tetraphosphatase ApaH/serine/threonine PP2A family protein phosphatase